VNRRYRLSRLPGLAVAIAIPVGAGMVALLGDIPIRRDVGLLLAVALIIVLAWAGGVWPGLVATLILVVLFAGPIGSDLFYPALDNLSLFLFAAAGLVVTTIVESLHRARWRVEAARDRARTSRRAEHEARSELESIVAAIGDGIIVSDAHGSISIMNQAAIDLVGSRVKRFDAVAEAFTSDDEGLTPAQLLAGQGPKTAEFGLAADGRRIELATYPLASEGEPERRILLLRDVTDARRQERLRDAFLSLLSHELRTPMTAVYGGATLLQSIGDRLDPETRQELRADIVNEADRLSRLIDDLLVLSRVEGGTEVGREPALLQHLVTEVAANDARGTKPGTIVVEVEPGLPPVIGDETSIRQVTHNLISNALKYSRGSTVEVRVEALDEDEVGVRVLDRGPGLGGAEADVFDLFFRGPITKGVAPGLGIGLFVCRRLVEAMGGRIWTKARDGGGTEFGFALEVWPLEDEVDDEPEAQETDAKRPLAAARSASGDSW
jgi:two-component system sensor histidine kinase KdpD